MQSLPIPPLPLPNDKSHSLKDDLAGSLSSSTNLHFMHFSFKGYSVLMLDDFLVSLLGAPFALTLMVKFMHKRPNLDIIWNFFLNHKFSGSCQACFLDPQHISIQLSKYLDYS